MLREYEFTLITRGDLSDGDRQKSIEKYEQILFENGGVTIQKNDWGVKKLAHAIKRNFKGHYMNYDLKTTPAQLAEAERLMRIDDNVLRYMSVKIGDDVDVEARKAELIKQAAVREARHAD